MNKIYKNVLSLTPISANIIRTASASVVVIPLPKDYTHSTWDGKNVCLWLNENKGDGKSNIDTKSDTVKKVAQLQ